MAIETKRIGATVFLKFSITCWNTAMKGRHESRAFDASIAATFFSLIVTSFKALGVEEVPSMPSLDHIPNFLFFLP
jgi:hypothetical protein